MLDFDPRATTRATTSATNMRRVAGTEAPPTTAIVMTTGGNPTSDRATAMTTMRGRPAAVQAAIGKPRRAEIVVTLHAGASATATVESAIARGAARPRHVRLPRGPDRELVHP
jgi:hypothetical protein